MKACLTKLLFNQCAEILDSLGITLEYHDLGDSMNATGKVKEELSSEQWLQAYFTVYRLMQPDLGTFGQYYIKMPYKGFTQGYDQRMLAWSLINDILIEHFDFPKQYAPRSFYHPVHNPHEKTVDTIIEQIYDQKMAVRALKLNFQQVAAFVYAEAPVYATDPFQHLNAELNILTQPGEFRTNNFVNKAERGAMQYKINLRTGVQYQVKLPLKQNQDKIFSDKLSSSIIPNPQSRIMKPFLSDGVWLGYDYLLSDTRSEMHCCFYNYGSNARNHRAESPDKPLGYPDNFFGITGILDAYKSKKTYGNNSEQQFGYNLDSLECIFVSDRRDHIFKAVAARLHIEKLHQKTLPIIYYPLNKSQKITVLPFSKILDISSNKPSLLEQKIYYDFLSQDSFRGYIFASNAKDCLDIMGYVLNSKNKPPTLVIQEVLPLLNDRLQQIKLHNKEDYAISFLANLSYEAIKLIKPHLNFELLEDDLEMQLLLLGSLSKGGKVRTPDNKKTLDFFINDIVQTIKIKCCDEVSVFMEILQGESGINVLKGLHYNVPEADNQPIFRSIFNAVNENEKKVIIQILIREKNTYFLSVLARYAFDEFYPIEATINQHEDVQALRYYHFYYLLFTFELSLYDKERNNFNGCFSVLNAARKFIDKLATPTEIQYFFNQMGIGCKGDHLLDPILSKFRHRKGGYRETNDSGMLGEDAKQRLKQIVSKMNEISQDDHEICLDVFSRNINRFFTKRKSKEMVWYQKNHPSIIEAHAPMAQVNLI